MFQRSLEDELNRTTIQDLPIFAMSYIVVFAYISLALGTYSNWKRVMVRVTGTQKGVPESGTSSANLLKSS